jgi:hypothetical protein
MSQTVDVTGLSPEAVRIVEQFVASLRQGPPASSKGDPWGDAAGAVRGLTDYDFGAWEEQRAFDQQRGQDHLQ